MIENPSFLEKMLIFYARRIPIAFGKIRIIDALWKICTNGRGVYRMAVLKYGNFKMKCNISEMLQRQYYFFGTYFLEERNIRCWQSFSKKSNVIFDVGANAGIYSLAAISVNSQSEVYSFEPTSEIAANFRATLSLNHISNIHISEVAVSKESGFLPLHRCRGELGINDGMNYISSEIVTSESEVVKTVSLDQFCRQNGVEKIDLLKMDIQGHEYLALLGAHDLLSSGRIETIFMELNWGVDVGGVCVASESIKILENNGYFFSIPSGKIDLKESGQWMVGLSDIVARRHKSIKEKI